MHESKLLLVQRRGQFLCLNLPQPNRALPLERIVAAIGKEARLASSSGPSDGGQQEARPRGPSLFPQWHT